MAIGRVGSFATDSPLAQNYVGQALTDTENQGFRYRKERRDIAEAKKKEEEDKQTEISTGLGSIDQVKTSKFATHNALAIDGAGKLYKYIADKGKLYSQGKISKVEFEIAKQNAKAQISQMNQATERLNGQVADYSKMIEQGKIASGFEQNALELGKAYDNVNMYFDEVGDDGILNVVAYDDNGKIIEKSGLAKFGQNAFTPVSAFDIDKDKSEFIKTYPKVLRENLGSTSKTGIKGITPEIESAIELKVDALVKDRNALANANYKRTGVPNPNVTDPEEIKKTKESLRQEYLAMYSPEKTVDEATQRANLEETKRKARREEQKEEIIISEPSIIVNNNGVRNGIKMQKNTKDFPIGNAIIKLGDGKQKKATNVFVSPGGKIYLETQEIGFKTNTKNEFNLTASGKKKQEEAKKKQGKNFNIKEFYETLESGDYNSASVSDRTPQARMLDFGKDGEEIGPYALKMGYKSAKEMQDDFIRRSGGDAFITTPDERPNNGQTRTEISRSELASKAKASGYTTQEYEKLLKAKGITIK